MSRSRYVILEPDKPHFLTCTVVEWLSVFTRPDAVQFLLDSRTHLRQHDGFQGNETTGRWSAMGCVPTLERGNDKIKLPAQALIPGPSPGGGRGWNPLPSGEGRVSGPVANQICFAASLSILRLFEQSNHEYIQLNQRFLRVTRFVGKIRYATVLSPDRFGKALSSVVRAPANLSSANPTSARPA